MKTSKVTMLLALIVTSLLADPWDSKFTFDHTISGYNVMKKDGGMELIDDGMGKSMYAGEDSDGWVLIHHQQVPPDSFTIVFWTKLSGSEGKYRHVMCSEILVLKIYGGKTKYRYYFDAFERKEENKTTIDIDTILKHHPRYEEIMEGEDIWFPVTFTSRRRTTSSGDSVYVDSLFIYDTFIAENIRTKEYRSLSYAIGEPTHQPKASLYFDQLCFLQRVYGSDELLTLDATYKVGETSARVSLPARKKTKMIMNPMMDLLGRRIINIPISTLIRTNGMIKRWRK